MLRTIRGMTQELYRNFKRNLRMMAVALYSRVLVAPAEDVLELIGNDLAKGIGLAFELQAHSIDVVDVDVRVGEKPDQPPFLQVGLLG